VGILKSFILVQDVLEAQQLEGSDPYVVHKDNVMDVYGENSGGDLSLVFFLHANLQLSLLYKFVEEYQGDLKVYATHAQDLVFLARFSDIQSTLSFSREEMPPSSPWAKDLRSIKALMRPPT
jgi:hypothetical protein